MKALLSRSSGDDWVLNGCVDYDLAEALVTTLDLQQGSPSRINLQDARGGAALLLVLLSWHRNARQLGVSLQFINPSQELMRVAELSGLDLLLPFVPSAH
ncbi:MAG: STAS domain-containing protein [Marinospirillum sp.]|uniref:STAS domain-containing protein n=1 Tax=Marinospirillum sp. TaxID=2183934 RepID=UPI0019EE7C22|nr:STAS domain-containing protein [Marinospirillum sp.]MBE0505342.1 STAS domain-containing protein [Marinospirillum sp.]